MWDARLSSFIACLARQVSNRGSGYNRGLHVFSVSSIPGRYPCHTEILFLGIWFIVVRASGTTQLNAVCSEMPVEESLRSIRRRAPTLARRLALDDALSGADWSP